MKAPAILALAFVSTFACAQQRLGVGTVGLPQAPIHVGDSTSIGGSVDPQVLVSRNVDSSVSGNAHAFSDASIITRPGVIGYNSYDASVTFNGSNSFDHYAAFQASAAYASTGTMGSLYGLFANIQVDGPVINSFGMYVPDLIGTGTLQYQYGLYVAPLTKGALLNYGVYTGGSTPSYFGGNVTMGTATVQSLTTSGAAGGKRVVCADTSGNLYVSSTGTDCSN